MKTSLVALALAAAAGSAFSVPASGQTRAEESRWDSAQRRFEEERAIYERERERYEQAVERDRYGYRDDRYDRDRRWDSNQDPARYYRDDPRYGERRLGANDEVYRGSDGRYYCRRSDGTVGLVVGAGAGALIGRAIDGGRSRAGGTIVGGVLGALLGREVERNADVRCR
jgi:hypothetical protein